MREDHLEPETLVWLANVGYEVEHGLIITPDGEPPERRDFRQVVLEARLRAAVDSLNLATPC